ncbi:BON domain-containing protein [Microvirga sp. GCM10011540]|uniref:BON domain-containing protein n=1 Tax=Microvirga sp. GCM10011540 TaxID=3317338 RepID=UPI003615186C
MANDRYRYERDRYRDRDTGWRDRNEEQASRGRYAGYGSASEDDGYIARRGFGNDRSGYGGGRRDDEPGRERDFGDSAGYGTGGSALDWREVMGEDTRSDRRSYDRVFGQDRGRENPGYGSSYRREGDRSDTGYFGRGSRDYNEDRGFFERAGDEVRSWFGDDDADRRRDTDMRRAESHRGRGPRGYQRSDERIREDVNDRLTDDPHLDASEVEVSVSNREVTLTGTVNSRFEKRHAEDLAESVSGVTHVQNNLRIQQAADAGIAGSMLSGEESRSTPATGGSGTGTARRRSTSSSRT